jgi:hypothetical protein
LISKTLVRFKNDNFISVISKIKKTSSFRSPYKKGNRFEEVFRTNKLSKEKNIIENPWPNIGKLVKCFSKSKISGYRGSCS